MARRKKGRKRTKKKVSLLTVAGTLPAIKTAYDGYGQAGIGGAAVNATWALTGYNLNTNKFEMEGLMRGTIPIIAGALGSKVASKFGINRMLSGIPYLKL